MTDDFQLFPDQGGGDSVDPDIALITAYLARELSLVQIVAVEDRLANDRAFREKVRPILEAWVSPTPLQAVHAGERPLSREEVEAGWERYVGERAELDAHAGPRLVVGGEQPKRRKISMTRIAAGIAAITLPIVTLAQVVVYAAKRPDVPGHAVAKEIVRPFAEPSQVTPEAPTKPLPSPVDVRVGQQLEKPAPELQPAAATQVNVPIGETARPALGPTEPVAQPRASQPDREKIASLARQHMPEVIRGDTNASYMVMVLDQADNYLWGTHGMGPLVLIVGGDRRTSAARREFQRENATAYNGTVAALNARDTLASGGRGGGFAGNIIRPDTGLTAALAARAGRGGGGGAGARARPVAPGYVDTAWIAKRVNDTVFSVDSFQRARITTRGGDTARIGFITPVVTVGGGGGGGGGRGGALVAAPGISDWIDKSDSTSYSIGHGRFGSGQALNAAAGLQEPRIGESGIQGVKSAWLTMGETYTFAPGQLTRQIMRVVVVHLAPGTGWKGR